MKHVYKIRYLVELWNKPPQSEDVGESSIPGVRQSTTDYGYADDLFVASIVRSEDGKAESILLMDSISGSPPDKKMLELVKKQIEHYLEHHT